MLIHSFPYPIADIGKRVANKTIIIVDALRSSNTIIQALENGALEIIPVKNALDVKVFSSHWQKNEGLIAGEFNGEKIPGFDLGNSPLEFTTDAVEDKKVILFTSNGTAAIHCVNSAKLIYIASMRNKKAVAKLAIEKENDIFIICAGTAGECSVDDTITAGGIYSEICALYNGEIEINGYTTICSTMYSAWKKKEINIFDTSNAKHLKNIGFEEDIEFCFKEDTTSSVPLYENGVIKLIQ